MKRHTGPVLIPPISMRLFLFSLLFVCLSCKSQKKSTLDNEEPVAMDRPTLILKETHSNIDSAQVEVIKDQKALKAFFIMVNKTRKPGLPVPEIDFSKNMLILICAGEQRGEQEPKLSILEEHEGELIIEIAETNRAAYTDMAISTPFYLYKVPISQKKIIIKKTDI